MATRKVKRQGGAQPGNLNSSIYPWRALWRRGKLRAQDMWVAQLSQKYLTGIHDDKGGQQNMSNIERRVADIAMRSYTAQMLMWNEFTQGADEFGLPSVVEQRVTDSGIETRLKAVFLEMSRFAESERRSLCALGLGRRSKNVKLNWYEIADEQNGNNGAENNNGDNGGGTDDDEEDEQ